MAQRLAASDTDNAQSQRDVAVGWHRLMLAHQQTGNLEGWREASQRAVEGFDRVHQATSGDPASLQDLTRTLAQACDGLSAFPSPTPADLQVALARARQLVALSDTADASHLETLAKFQFLTDDVPGAVASLEQALGTVPDGPDAAAQCDRESQSNWTSIASPCPRRPRLEDEEKRP